MPHEASWAGSPSIKGSTESIRMALLTFSLIGLQCVLFLPLHDIPPLTRIYRITWGIEMTCTCFPLPTQDSAPAHN